MERGKFLVSTNISAYTFFSLTLQEYRDSEPFLESKKLRHTCYTKTVQENGVRRKKKPEY